MKKCIKFICSLQVFVSSHRVEFFFETDEGPSLKVDESSNYGENDKNLGQNCTLKSENHSNVYKRGRRSYLII